MANVCFGCNDVEDIKKCPKKECSHYEYRNEHLSMDTGYNEEIDYRIKKNWNHLIKGRK
jgi:hypothetical protein